jgi:hypothetical protein
MTSQDLMAGMQSMRPACPPFSTAAEVAAAATAYHFPSHVHYAVVHETIIFMDLRADQYCLLTGEKARLFATLCAPALNSRARDLRIDPASPSENARARDALVTELLNCNLLSMGAAAAVMNRAELPPPRADFLADGDAGPQCIHLRDVWRFVIACLVCAWRLRYTTIEATVGAVGRRRTARTPDRPPDRSELHRLVALFRRMRPLVPKDALCLFDSLALLEFLAQYGCFPHWVFAVTLTPWSAHCWVQYEDVCLNEDAERARHYTVILVA